MDSLTDISRREFVVNALAVAGALGIAGVQLLAPRNLPSMFHAIVEDVAAGRAPRATYAPRLDMLDGRTIAFVSNGAWEAPRTFALLRERLEQAHACTVIDEHHFPVGQGIIAKENNGIAETMATLGVEAAILGNGG